MVTNLKFSDLNLYLLGNLIRFSFTVRCNSHLTVNENVISQISDFRGQVRFSLTFKYVCINHEDKRGFFNLKS